MNASEFLVALGKIPHLLDLARQQDDMLRYQAQKTLREQHRRLGQPFLYSMPMRHLYTCPLCGHQGTDILHELEDPSHGTSLKFVELVLHQAQAHAVPPEEDLSTFLAACLEQVG